MTGIVNVPAGSAPDPVSLIEEQLDREENPAPQKPPRNQASDRARGSTDTDPEPEPEDDDDLPEPEPGPGDDPADDDAEDEDAEPEAASAEPLYTVKIDGREEHVPLTELLKGYQRQQDYSKKTALAAEERRAAETLAQSIQAERQHYNDQLTQVATVLQAQLPPPPDPATLDTDPIGYLQAEKHYEARVAQLRHVLGEQQRVQQQTQQQAQAQQQQMLEKAREQLVEMLPDWKQPKVAKKEQPLIANHLRTLGYADHEIASAADPRAVVMARESMLYRQLMASKSEVQQKVAQAPRMVRPGSGGPAPDKTKAVIQQLKRSGGKDLDLAARLIEMG